MVFSWMKWLTSILLPINGSKLNSVSIFIESLNTKHIFLYRLAALVHWNIFSGEDILLPNGEINRIALGQLVFNDVEKRGILNYITHPPIHQTIYKQIIKYFVLGHNFVVLDLPLLFESGRFLPYIHKIITVTWYVLISVTCLNTTSNWWINMWM